MGNKVSIPQDERDEAEYKALIQAVEEARRQDLEAGYTGQVRRVSASKPRPPLLPDALPIICEAAASTKSWETIPSFHYDASVRSHSELEDKDDESIHRDATILPVPQRLIAPITIEHPTVAIPVPHAVAFNGQPEVIPCEPQLISLRHPTVVLPSERRSWSRSSPRRSPSPIIVQPISESRRLRSSPPILIRDSVPRSRSRSRSRSPTVVRRPRSSRFVVIQPTPSRRSRSRSPVELQRGRPRSRTPLPIIVRPICSRTRRSPSISPTIVRRNRESRQQSPLRANRPSSVGGAPTSIICAPRTANSSPKRISSSSRGRSRSPRPVIVRCGRRSRSPTVATVRSTRTVSRSRSRSPSMSGHSFPKVMVVNDERCRRSSSVFVSSREPHRRMRSRSPSPIPPGSRPYTPIIVWHPQGRSPSRMRPSSPSRLYENTLASSVKAFSERITDLQDAVGKLTHAMESSLQRSTAAHSKTVHTLTAMEKRLNIIENSHGAPYNNPSLTYLVPHDVDLPGRLQPGEHTKDVDIKGLEMQAYNPNIVLASGLGHPFLQKAYSSETQWSPPWKVFPLKAFRGSDFTYVKIQSHWDDESLLRQVSETYDDLRKFWRKWFSLRSVSSITMVLADHTLVFPQRIGPAKVSPSKNLRLRYLLSHPHTMRGKHEFMEVLTSRTDIGIEFVERFQLGRIAVAVIVPVIASAILAIVYSILTDDVSSAFTISSYMTGAYSVCLVLIGILNLVEA